MAAPGCGAEKRLAKVGRPEAGALRGGHSSSLLQRAGSRRRTGVATGSRWLAQSRVAALSSIPIWWSWHSLRTGWTAMVSSQVA
jgi:hypothetical protein